MRLSFAPRYARRRRWRKHYKRWICAECDEKWLYIKFGHRRDNMNMFCFCIVEQMITGKKDIWNIAAFIVDVNSTVLSCLLSHFPPGVRLFARRTFTTPKIRTFTTRKFGYFPPPKKKHLPGGQLPPPIFSLFFWLIFLGFFDLQLMEDIKDEKEEVLDEVVMEHIK